MSQALVDELKRRGEELLKTANQHLILKPSQKELKEIDPNVFKGDFLTKLEEMRDALQNKADTIYENMDKLEAQQRSTDELLDSVKDLIDIIADIPDTN